MRFRKLMVMFVAVMMTATACGTGDSTDNTSTTSAEATTTTQAATTTAPESTDSTEPTTEAEPYTVVVIGSLTGAQGPQGAPIPDGIATALDEINAAGGVNGHPIEYEVLDDQSDTTAAQAVARDAISAAPVAILDGSSPTFSARLPLYQAAEITVIAANPIGIPNYPWLYGMVATAKQLANGLVNGGEAAVGGSLDGKRVAIVGIDSPATRATVEDVSALIVEKGGTVTSAQFVPPGSASFDSGAANILAEEADVVLIQDSAAGTVLEANALTTAGFENPIVVQYAGSDDVTLEAMNSANVYGLRPYNYASPGTPTYEAAERHGRTEVATNEGFIRGWLMAYTLAAGLEACEYPCPAAELQVALDGLGEFDVPGEVLEFGPLQIGADRHHPLTSFGLYRYDPSTGEVSAFGPRIDLGEPDYPQG